MKALIISDIHANITALEAVWAQESDADVIICLGDIVDYGIHPAECCEWLMDKQALVVAGNHDQLVTAAYDRPEDHEVLTWRVDNARKLSAQHIAYLKGLPEHLVYHMNGHDYGLSHSYVGYETIQSLEAFTAFAQQRFHRPVQRMLFGHTHRRGLHYLSDQHVWLNPGSVSYRRPDELGRGADYAVLCDGEISLRRVPYATEHLHRAVQAAAVNDQEKAVTIPWWSPQ